MLSQFLATNNYRDNKKTEKYLPVETLSFRSTSDPERGRQIYFYFNISNKATQRVKNNQAICNNISGMCTLRVMLHDKKTVMATTKRRRNVGEATETRRGSDRDSTQAGDRRGASTTDCSRRTYSRFTGFF